jgi:predicted deacetylase
MSRSVCIALHDVAPATWPQCSRLLTMLRELGDPPLTLLVVPDYHGGGRIDRSREFVRAVEQRIGRGDELALHGYDHLDHAPAPRTPAAWLRRRVLTASEGEFSELACAEARTRIDRGLEIFERLGWQADGFVAPAWLASAGTRAALRQFSLRYTSTHTQLIDLRHDRHHRAPCLTASPRSAWRRRASQLWLATTEILTAQSPLIRIGLHPADALHADLIDCWRGLLTRLLRQRTALTKTQAVDERLQSAARDSSGAAASITH